jgi:hypothetical protein
LRNIRIADLTLPFAVPMFKVATIFGRTIPKSVDRFSEKIMRKKKVALHGS